MLDVIDHGRKRALVGEDHALLDLLRAQPGVRPNDADDRDIDGRKNIRRRAQDHEWREEQEQERADHERQRPAQG